MTDEELIARLRTGEDLHVLAANRIEALVKERDVAVKVARNEIGWRGQAEARAEAAEARVKQLEQLDSEAATYVESVIAMRTHFTGEPPYVGWKGLGLALNEALDARDAAEAKVTVLVDALEALAIEAENDCKTPYFKAALYFARAAIASAKRGE